MWLISCGYVCGRRGRRGNRRGNALVQKDLEQKANLSAETDRKVTKKK